MTYTNTISDVQKQTGLKEPFIRKTLISLKDIFNPYMKRGKNNSLLFDSNAMVLWDKIKQSKEQNLSIEYIKDNLGLSTNSQTEVKGGQSELNQQSNHLIEMALKSLQDNVKVLLLAKDETIQSKDMVILELKNKMLLLTDGKEPEIIKNEYKQKDIDLALLKKDLDNKNVEINLISSRLETIESNKKKEQELLQELANLENKFFFTGRKRKALLSELQNLILN